MKRYAAILNAQNVWAWASSFGHGDVVCLTKNDFCVQLAIRFPYDKFIKDREDYKVRNVTVAGAEFRWENVPDLECDILHITWKFD